MRWDNAVIVLAAVTVLLAGCTAAPPVPEEEPAELTLAEAERRCCRYLGALRTEEMLRQVAGERFDRRRQLELPGLLAHADTVEDELRLQLLDEARNYCAVVTREREGDLEGIQRRITERQLEFETASRYCRLAALESGTGSDPATEIQRRQLEMELALSLGIPSRELPRLDLASLPTEEAELAGVDPEFAAFTAGGGWDDPGAELRYARLLFLLPGELVLRNITDSDGATERLAGLADRIGGGFQQRLLLRKAADAVMRLREARERGDRAQESSALLEWRLAWFRLRAVKPEDSGGYTREDREWLRELAVLTGE